jgi:hypothetical protein
VSEGSNRPRVAFHAPMKPPDHPNPSGDRRIARLTLRALDRAGFDARLVSRLRSRDGAGDAAAQARILAEAEAERRRLLVELRAEPPVLWLTYHCYWKAPDLLGPALSDALGLPYAVVEGTRSPARLSGPWAGFAARAEAALDRARVLFWFTERDRPALEAARPPGQRLARLAPFAALGAPARRPVSTTGPLRLVAAAMMRAPDKTASYAALAAALDRLADVDWRLAVLGGGPEEAAVRAHFARFGRRVAFAGRRDSRAEVHAAYEAADLLVWPGVNEGFGMVYLEAQAAGRAVVAEDRPGVRAVVAPSGRLVPPGDADAFAGAIRGFARDRAALAGAGREARAHMEARHGLDAAAATLRAELAPLLAGAPA